MIILHIMALAFTMFAAPTPQDASTGNVFIPSEEAERNRRGISFNDEALPHLFMGYNNKIGWMYNWASDLCGSAYDHTGVWVDYVPMLHSDRSDHVDPWYVLAIDMYIFADAIRVRNVDRCASFGDGNYPIHVLAFNEPDNCEEGKGGACMSMDAVLWAWYLHIQPLASRYGDRVKLGSPAVTNANDGTDRAGLRFLESFIRKCYGCKIDFVNVHWYDGAHQIDYFKRYVQDALGVGNGRPVWITEFGLTSGSDEEKRRFLAEVLPWLDSQRDVHRYAYQMTAKGVLVNDDGTGLSNLGNVYTYV